MAARVWVGLNVLDEGTDLIDRASVRRGPGSPLMAVHGSEIAVFVCPFIPDFHAVLVEVGDVGVPGEKPQQLVNDRLEVELLRSEQGKAPFEIATHLIAEYAPGARTRAVGLFHAVVEDVSEKIEVLSHGGLSVWVIRIVRVARASCPFVGIIARARCPCHFPELNPVSCSARRFQRGYHGGRSGARASIWLSQSSGPLLPRPPAPRRPTASCG